MPGIGNKTLRHLYDYFKDGEVVWMADKKTLLDSKCLSEKTLSELIEFRQVIHWRN